MKTDLNRTIKSQEDAKRYLIELVRNNEIYHPDEKAGDIIWQEGVTPATAEETIELDRLMGEVHQYMDDPCALLMGLYLTSKLFGR